MALVRRLATTVGAALALTTMTTATAPAADAWCWFPCIPPDTLDRTLDAGGQSVWSVAYTAGTAGTPALDAAQRAAHEAQRDAFRAAAPRCEGYEATQPSDAASVSTRCADRLTDTEAPAAPTALTATVDRHDVRLEWPASTSADARRYRVSVASALEGPFSPWTSTWGTSAYLRQEPGTTRYYRVSAVDDADNESGPSPIANATSAPPIAPVTELGAEATSSSEVRITWAPNPEPYVRSYLVRSHYSWREWWVNEPSFTQAGLPQDAKLTYSVTAYDDRGTASSSVSVTVTTPPPGPGRYGADQVLRSGWWIRHQDGHLLGQGTVRLSVFTGRSVRWIGRRDECGATARVHLDDRVVATVDQRTTDPAADGTVLRLDGLDDGRHSITIETLPVPEGSAGSCWRTSFDAFVVE